MTGDTKGYAVARLTLIKAVRALRSLPTNSVILVGAHAVYLRAPEAVASIPSFTFDGDLAVDPQRIRRPRFIRQHLEAAGFVLRGQHSGFYSVSGAPADESYASRIDILVPDGVQHLWDNDGYDSNDVSATATQCGLELCLLDHSPMILSPIGWEYQAPSIEVEVAGIVALLIAKSWKIGERFDQGLESFQEVTKDIADIYRLLRASRLDEIEATLRQLPSDEVTRSVCITGAQYLRKLCSSGGPGIALLRNIVGSGEEAAIILASLEALVEEFCELVEKLASRRPNQAI